MSVITYQRGGQHVTANRPRRYRRPLFALVAIERLSKKGWSDPEIAEALWDLSPNAIRSLEKLGWVRENLQPWLIQGSGDPSWTARQVRYYRRKLGRPSPDRPRAQHLTEEREAYWREYAVDQGWGHLLPDHELRPHVVDILSLIRDRGSQTKGHILDTMGCDQRRPAQMVKSGLLYSSMTNKGYIWEVTYALAVAAHPNGKRLQTSVECKYG